MTIEERNKKIEEYIIYTSNKLNSQYDNFLSNEKIKKAIEMFTSAKYDNYSEEQIIEEINKLIQQMLEEREKQNQEYLKKMEEHKRKKFEELKNLYEQTREKYGNIQYEISQIFDVKHMQSFNETKEVQLIDPDGKVVNGFYKGISSPNEYELLVSRLGKIMNIPVAEYSLYLNNNQIEGISISCIPDKNIYEFLSGYDFVKEYPEVSSIVQHIKENPQEPKPELNKGQTRYYMDLLLKGFEKKVKDPIQLEKLKKEYFETVLFNLILDQKDYNFTNFAVLYNKKNDFYEMAPLFDNGAIKENPSIEGTMVTTLGRSSKDDILTLLYTTYYPYIQDFSNKLASDNLLTDKISECVNDTLSEKERKNYLKTVLETLKKVRNKEEEIRINVIFKNVLGESVPQQMLDKKISEYLQSNSNIDMASFLFNDLTRYLSSKNIDKTEEIKEMISRVFCLTPKQLMDNSRKVIENNIKTGQMPITENHKLVHETVQKLCKLLTENNVDYYLVGALPCYLLTGEKDERYHDDIDLMLNEEDIPKVSKLLSGTEFDFQDKRQDTPKRQKNGQLRPSGDHEVMAQHKTSEFHLGFFCFERGNDGEVIHKDYFKDDKGELKVFKHMITPERSKLDYDDTLHTYGDSQFKMASLESTYSIKKSTMNNPGREKDITDIKMIEKSGKLDQKKLRIMKSQPHLEPQIEIVKEIKNFVPSDSETKEDEQNKTDSQQQNVSQITSVTDSEIKSISFPKRSKEETKISEQIRAKNEAIKKAKEEARSLNKPKVKTLTKSTNTGNDNSSSRGFVDTLILTFITGFFASIILIIIHSILK